MDDFSTLLKFWAKILFMNAPLKLLLIVPHPDDEVYGASGTILDFLAEGKQVGLITLTKGEGGRNLGLADSKEDLAELRAGPDGELKKCLEVLGVTLHHQHNYPDGGLKDWDFEELVTVTMQHIQNLKPEIVLTFPPNGSNGHFDHVITHKVVYEALERLNRPCTLWYYSAPKKYTTQIYSQKPELEALHTEPQILRNVTQHIATKLRAIAQHRSQALSTVDWLKVYAERTLEETFHQAYPPLEG